MLLRAVNAMDFDSTTRIASVYFRNGLLQAIAVRQSGTVLVANSAEITLVGFIQSMVTHGLVAPHLYLIYLARVGSKESRACRHEFADCTMMFVIAGRVLMRLAGQRELQ